MGDETERTGLCFLKARLFGLSMLGGRWLIPSGCTSASRMPDVRLPATRTPQVTLPPIASPHHDARRLTLYNSQVITFSPLTFLV